MLLYVDPPAFGLASSRAESIAAIAYCHIYARDAFTLDTTTPASVLVTQTLPTLHDTASDLWVAGFHGIVAHFARIGLDEDVTDMDDATRAAMTGHAALMSTKASDLTAIYLYGDETNYTTYTRHQIAAGLPVPRNYTVPHNLRQAALALLEEYGLSSTSDVASRFFTSNNTSSSSSAGGGSNGGSPAVAASTSSGSHHLATDARHQSRLLEAAETLYAVTEAALSQGAYLCGTRPGMMDCFVVAHLSLHLCPRVPHAYLARKIKDAYPRTWKYLVDANSSLRITLHDAKNEAHPPSQQGHGSDSTTTWRKVMQFVTSSLQQQQTESTKTEESREQRVKDAQAWRGKAVFVGAALASLVAFVWSNKLIVVELDDDEDDFTDADSFNQDEEM